VSGSVHLYPPSTIYTCHLQPSLPGIHIQVQAGQMTDTQDRAPGSQQQRTASFRHCCGQPQQIYLLPEVTARDIPREVHLFVLCARGASSCCVHCTVRTVLPGQGSTIMQHVSKVYQPGNTPHTCTLPSF